MYILINFTNIFQVNGSNDITKKDREEEEEEKKKNRKL